MWGIRRYLICGFIILFGSSLYLNAQSNTYSYQSDKHNSLINVIEQLEQSYAIEFSYAIEAIQNVQIDKGNYQAESLNDLINKFLSGSGLEFQIIDRRKILLRPIQITNNQLDSDATITYFKIEGYIYDDQDRPVSFANVALDTLYLGATTNDDGYFEFDVPNELMTRKINVQYIGYQTISVSISTFINDPKIYLSQTSLDLDEVVVTSKVPSLEIKPIINSTQAQAAYLNEMITPVMSNDIIRGVQMMAGVSASNDASAEIKIRGSQADETLIMLDGIPIYKADHFYGIFGSVNGNHIQNATLHKNSMPINFGGKSGGMLELSSSDFINKTEGIADINMLTSSLTLKTPISKKLGLILSGRTTYDNAANSKIFDWVEPNIEEEILNNFISTTDRPLLLQTFPEIQFFDWNSKVIFNPSDNHRISFSAFSSQDDYQNGYDISFQNRQTSGGINGREEFNDIEKTKNFGLSLQYQGQLSNDWEAELSIYHSMYNYSGILSTSLGLERNNFSSFSQLTNAKENTIIDNGGHIQFSKKYGITNKLVIGASAVDHDIFFNFIADNTRSFEVNPTGYEASIFGQYVWTPTEDWTLQFGNRLDYYSGTEKIYYNPRVDVSRRINNAFSFKSSISRNFQFVREVTHYTRLREPIEIYLLTSEIGARKYPVGSSLNTMLGMLYSKNNWTLDSELYYKDIDGVIEHTQQILGNNSDQNKIEVRDYQTIIGQGSVIGLDLTIGYEDQSFSSWLAYTLSKSTNRFENLFQGAAIPASDDRRHQLKWSAQFKVNNWLIHGGYVFSSGLNQINLFELDEPLDVRGILQDNTFDRIDPYHRLDLGIDYKFQLLNSESTIGLSVFNATNNNNVDYVQYLFAIPVIRNNANRAALSGTTTQLLDRTFNLSFKMKW